MTTKKQKRQAAFMKRAAFDAETRRLGQNAINGETWRREQAQFDALRAKNKKANAARIKEMAKTGVNIEAFDEAGA